MAGAKEGKYRLLRIEREGRLKIAAKNGAFTSYKRFPFPHLAAATAKGKRPTTNNTMHFSSAATHANRTLLVPSPLKNFYSTILDYVVLREPRIAVSCEEMTSISCFLTEIIYGLHCTNVKIYGDPYFMWTMIESGRNPLSAHMEKEDETSVFMDVSSSAAYLVWWII